jgi:hypothetical protein
MEINNELRMSFRGSVIVATISFLCFWTSSHYNVLAQARSLRYDGPFRLNDQFSGRADYQYVITGKDTLKQGPFAFNTLVIDPANSNLFHSISYKGTFEKGRKNGPWIFSSKRIRPLEKYEESEYQIIRQSTGKEFLLLGNFKDGVATGHWQMLEQRIENSSPADTLTLVGANFNNGIMTGKVEGLFNGIRFSGKVSSEGFIEGNWVFRFLPVNNKRLEEHRIFNDGIQVSHFLIHGPDTLTLELPGLDKTVNENEQWERLDLNGRYFEIIEAVSAGLMDLGSAKLKGIGHETIHQSNALLENVLKLFHTESNMKFWKLVDGSDSLRPVSVRLKKVVITDAERLQHEEIRKRLDEAGEVFSRVFDEPIMEIDRLANKNLMFYYHLLKVYEERVNKIRNAVNQFSRPAFLYVNREEMLLFILENLRYPTHIQYEFKEERFSDPYTFPDSEHVAGSVTESVIKHLLAIVKDITRIEVEVDRILENKLKQARLIEKEKHLLKKKDSVLTLYRTDQDESLNPYHQQVSGRIQRYVQEIFENYAELKLTDKLDTIDYVVNCLNSFQDLYAAQAEIPAKLKRLEEAYTRTVWNPYTMTDMQERMKERVYTAFESHLLPYYLSDIEDSIDCSKLQNKHRNFDIMYRKMMELREQDTKEIERALRGVSFVPRIMQILNINFSSQ